MTRTVMIRATLAGVVASLSSLACSSGNGAADGAGGAAAHDASAQLDTIDDSTDIPCEPRRVLETVCQRCHARPARNGAPFALERRSDLFGAYGGVVIRELAIEQLTARRMPLAPVTISDDDREILLGWLTAGVPAQPSHTCGARPRVVETSEVAFEGTDGGDP